MPVRALTHILILAAAPLLSSIAMSQTTSIAKCTAVPSEIVASRRRYEQGIADGTYHDPGVAPNARPVPQEEPET